MKYCFSVLGYQIKHSFLCLIYYFSVFRYQMKHSFSYIIYYFSVFGNRMKHSFSCLIYYFSVFGYQMKPRDETLIMLEMYYFSEFGYRTKRSLPCLVYCLSVVWISDETLPLVYYIWRHGIWVSAFLQFSYYIISRCFEIRWDTFSRVWYVTCQCLDIVFDISS